MRYSFLIFSLFIFLCACNKENTTQTVPIYTAGEAPYGIANGKKNGFDFEAAAIVKKVFNHSADSFRYSLTLSTETDYQALREYITFGPLIKAGIYDLFRTSKIGSMNAGYSTLADDGDVLEDVYELDEAYQNTFEVTKFDTLQNIVEGIINMQMKIKTSREKRNPDNPDVVTFSDVIFSAQIVEF